MAARWILEDNAEMLTPENTDERATGNGEGQMNTYQCQVYVYSLRR